MFTILKKPIKNRHPRFHPPPELRLRRLVQTRLMEDKCPHESVCGSKRDCLSLAPRPPQGMPAQPGGELTGYGRGGGGETLPLPCASTALKVVAETLPLPCVSTAFVAKTLPFLAALRRAGGVLLSGRVEGEGGDHDEDEDEVEEEECECEHDEVHLHTHLVEWRPRGGRC